LTTPGTANGAPSPPTDSHPSPPCARPPPSGRSTPYSSLKPPGSWASSSAHMTLVRSGGLPSKPTVRETAQADAPHAGHKSLGTHHYNGSCIDQMTPALERYFTHYNYSENLSGSVGNGGGITGWGAATGTLLDKEKLQASRRNSTKPAPRCADATTTCF